MSSSLSSKRRNNVIKCSKCDCFVLLKDLKVHQEECSWKNWSNPKILFTSKTSIIVPKIGIVANNRNVTNAENFLPPDLVGWEKWNAVLMHPETMSTLCVTARQPCLLTNAERDSNIDVVGTLWPCDQVKKLQICVQDVQIGAKMCVNIANKITKVSSVQLRPSSGKQFLPIYTKADFLDYLKKYLSNGYMEIGRPVRIHYNEQEHKFDVILSDEEKLKMLDISSEFPIRLILKPESDCSYHIIDNTVTALSPPVTTHLTFADFGGAESIKMKTVTELIIPLKIGLKEPSSIIVSGETGCGKTLFLRIVQAYLHEKAIMMLKEEFKSFLENAKNINCEKMAILVDDFDKLTQYSDDLRKFMETRPNFVFVLAVCNIEAVDLSLRPRFRHEMHLPMPVLPDRVAILRIMFKSRKMDMVEAEKLIKYVADKTSGYTGSNLKDICDDVLDVNDAEIPALFKHFDAALERTRPSGIWQLLIEIPDVKWADIGGNQGLKLKIEEAISWRYELPKLFERLGTKQPSGILLYGPSGCGKTLIARAIASQSHMSFFPLKGLGLFNKWIDDPEKAVEELFMRVRQEASAIIFLDEIDAICANRGNGNKNRIGERVLQQLLIELDNMNKKEQVTVRKKGGLLMLAATNRPDGLDSELLGPGRFDLTIHVPLPNEGTRCEILNLRLRRMGVLVEADVKDIAKQTNGFSGAELVELCEKARNMAMLENNNAEKLESRHFLEALKNIAPRTDPKSLAIYEEFEKYIK